MRITSQCPLLPVDVSAGAGARNHVSWVRLKIQEQQRNGEDIFIDIVTIYWHVCKYPCAYIRI